LSFFRYDPDEFRTNLKNAREDIGCGIILVNSGFGLILTIKKALKKPSSESRAAWTIFFLGTLLNLLTVIIGTDTGFAVWLYPIILVVVVGTLVGILYLKPQT
jgi:nitrate reductase NapE component